MFGFMCNSDFDIIEKEYKRARSKYNRAIKKQSRYSIDNCDNHNQRAIAISELNAARDQLKVILEQYNIARNQLGMKPILIYGVNSAY